MKILSTTDLPCGQGHILSGIVPGDYLTAGGLSFKGPGDRSHDIGCTCKVCDGHGRHVHQDDHEVFIILAGKAEIVGATIINQDEEPRKCARLRALGCRIFDDHRDMLNELGGVAEFCMIPTGTPLHRTMTVAALEAGMHVLVEKPLAGCLEDASAMKVAAEKAGRIAAAGYQWLYTLAAHATKRHILEGRIGELQSIKTLVMWPRDHAYYTRNGWTGRLSVNGTVVNDSPFNNAVAHELMMMLFQAGATERSAAMPVSVDAELYRANAIESTDTACMRVDTEEGVPIRFYATHACRDNVGPELHIRGTKGSIVMTHRGSVIRPAAGDPITIATGGANAARQAMMAAVLDAVQGGSSFYCDLETASRQTKVVDAIHVTCEIQAVDGDTVTEVNGSVWTFIPGIEDAMRQAFDAEKRSLKGGFSVQGHVVASTRPVQDGQGIAMKVR